MDLVEFPIFKQQPCTDLEMKNSPLDRIIYRIKPHIPSPLWNALTTPYWWWYNRARHQVAACINPRLRQSQQELRRYRNLHEGERCFILGNGPSLRNTNLALLVKEFTFGLNRIYLHFPEMGYPTSYYVAVNTLVIEQCADDIKALSMPKFITWRGRKWVKDDPGTIFLDTDYTNPPTFSEDVSGRVFEGSTVTYVAMQLAFHLGFEDVILIGVDHSFTAKGRPNETVISNGGDPDHFSAQYFGKGFRWQLPDLDASERAYRMARDNFEQNGRRILDATVAGKLDVFPKVLLEDLF
jgi:hypothetical protein